MQRESARCSSAGIPKRQAPASPPFPDYRCLSNPGQHFSEIYHSRILVWFSDSSRSGSVDADARSSRERICRLSVLETQGRDCLAGPCGGCEIDSHERGGIFVPSTPVLCSFHECSTSFVIGSGNLQCPYSLQQQRPWAMIICNTVVVLHPVRYHTRQDVHMQKAEAGRKHNPSAPGMVIGPYAPRYGRSEQILAKIQ
ncbi:hypothetical protein ACVWWT_004194 [Pseudomonas sp. TE6349]